MTTQRKKKQPKTTYTVEWKKDAEDLWREHASGLTKKKAEWEAGVGKVAGQGRGQSGWNPWATVRILKVTEPEVVFLRKGKITL